MWGRFKVEVDLHGAESGGIGAETRLQRRDLPCALIRLHIVEEGTLTMVFNQIYHRICATRGCR